MAKPADKSSGETEKPSDKPTTETTGKTESFSASPSEAQGDSKDAKHSESEGDAQGRGASGVAASTSAFVERMKSQHKALQAILDKRTTASAEPLAIAKEFAAEWLPHDLVEREVLRGVARSGGAAGEAMAEVEIRKDLLNILLANLLDEGPRGAEKAALETLAEQFSALVQTGRREEGGLFQAVDSVLASGRLPVSQIERRYERARRQFQHLDDDAIGEAIELLAPRRLSVPEERQQSQRERAMPRYSSQTRDRDEQGRFLPEDERDAGRGGGYRSMPQRDEAGRFVSEDERRSRGRYDDEDERSRGRRSESRNADDDERRYESRGDDRRYESRGESRGYESREASRRGSEPSEQGRSGWYGDPEGHSEASRRGWERSEHRGSGWYGDREGHSEASRRGWETSEHGRSGWYGDPERHSEAARRGWEEGGHSSQRRDEGDNGRYGEHRRYEAARYESEDRRGSGAGYEGRRGGRSEDDDERSGSSRGQGWSGDPEGHSEASRRGWERRR